MSNIKPINLEVNSETLVFTPNGFPAKDVSEYFERSSGIPVGFPRVRMKIRRGNAQMDSKVEVQVDIPKLAETSPSTSTGITPNATRAFNAIAKFEFILPRQSGEADRDTLLQVIQGLASSDVVAEAVKELDFPY